MASVSGCNLWVWLVGVVVRRYIYVYRFPHITYLYSSCICTFFCSGIPPFCSLFLMFFVL